MSNLGTAEYFRSETASFYKLMGERSFWQDPEKASRALQGLFHAYMRAEDLTDSDVITFEAACFEYDKRLAYALASDIIKKV